MIKLVNFTVSKKYKSWCKDGKLHRDNDQPAVIEEDGPKYWMKNGQFHRDDDQPAIIYSNGSKDWYKNGIFIKLYCSEFDKLDQPFTSFK